MTNDRLTHEDRVLSKRFNNFVVLWPSYTILFTKHKRKKYYQCICDCTKMFIAETYEITSGIRKSCGCYRDKKAGERRRTHGFSKASEYKSWAGIKERCLNPSNTSYWRYGGRGIKVCERWLSFENFISDMGQKPGNEYSIDRINNNGDYEPENCRWATDLQQCENKSYNVKFMHNGELKTLARIAREVGIARPTIDKRLKRGWTFEEAIRK